MNMGSLGVGIREPQNNNAFNPFDPSNFESLTKPQNDFNRAPGAPVRSQHAPKNGPGAVNYLQNPSGNFTKQSLHYHGLNQQQTYLLHNQQSIYSSSMPNSYSQSTQYSSGSQQSSQTSSPADFRRQREQAILQSQYERAQATVRAQQENMHQLQLLQALYFQTQIQTQAHGMSAPRDRAEFQKNMQQYASTGAVPNLSNFDQMKRQNHSLPLSRMEFPRRTSIQQERINKHLSECLGVFNALKRDLEFHIYKEKLTTDEICTELQGYVLPHLQSNFSKLPSSAYKNAVFQLFTALQNCREASEQDAYYRNDITMKYLCDALDMLAKQLLAVRKQLNLCNKAFS